MKLEKFIQRPVLSTVISIIIVILGLIGLVSLPIEQYPDIAPPTIVVSTTYTGADAQTVLNSVVAPLEDVINGVENMNYMTSSAGNDGRANISVYFKQGTDPDMAAVNVQNRVAKATNLLPAEVIKVGVTTTKRQTNTLLIFGVYSPTDEYDEVFIENYLKINVVPQIMRVSGVGEASAFGNHDYSMRIWLNPDIMAQYKLVSIDVIQALSEQNIEAAPGKFGENTDQAFQYVLKYKGRLQTPTEFGDVIIRTNANGEELKLKDIAEIEMGALSNTVISGAQGHPGSMIGVYQMPGTNATQVIKDIQSVIKEASKDFPKGMEYIEMQNSNDFLYASINKVLRTLFEAFILVFIVVYIFLQDFRSTLIPAIAVPVAIIGTFFFLYLFGFSINLLTLFALILAIAIVVDDAIVVVEAVHAKLDQNYRSAKTATIDAMNEISGAIVSITLVMASVFIPVTFIGGTSGIFFRQFGLTLAIAIVLSAINALTLSPALCALFLKPHEEEVNGIKKKPSLMSRFHTAFNVAFAVTTKKYKSGVNFFLRKPILSFAIVALFILGLFTLMKTTPTGLVPNEDNGIVFVGVNLPPATTLKQTDHVMDKMADIMSTMPEIKGISKLTGFGFISGSGSCYGNFIISLQPWDKRKGKGQDLDGVI
ncbi:MAG: efflux RND transporter permease subunit, partial [Bacteroidales bacterium]